LALDVASDRTVTVLAMATCVIVGAGLAGIAAASLLGKSGWRVTVLDKGRGLGGRLATRRGDHGLAWDHGAPALALTTTSALTKALAPVRLRGAMTKWPAGDRFASPMHAAASWQAWKGIPGMSAIPRDLSEEAEGEVAWLTSWKVENIEPGGGSWIAHAQHQQTMERRSFEAQGLVLTTPAPQAIALLNTVPARHDLDAAKTSLQRVTYDPCLTLMAAIDGEVAMRYRSMATIQPSDSIIASICNQRLKGVSTESAIVAHATREFSRDHVDADAADVHATLEREIARLLECRFSTTMFHRWRFAQAVTRVEAPCLLATEGLAIAGDSFAAAGAGVESAWASGLAAADSLLSS